MPTQVLPITDLAKAGVIMDTPAVSLPPNVFSDVQNVRFRDGAIRKMEGESELFRQLGTDSPIVYVAYWQGSFNNWYVIVQEDGDIRLHSADVRVPATPIQDVGNIYQLSGQQLDPPIAAARFQHTLFNGGFNFILNNGVSTPVYITDTDLNLAGTVPDAAPLPNWDSYLAQRM